MAELIINDGTGFRMNYEITENVLDQDTLFIHGNLASARWWYPLEEVLKKNKSGKSGKMILADFRGCGKSADPKDLSEITIDRLADDFIYLIEHLNLQKINLVGHSTGGTIVAMMAAKKPKLFNKLVLLDPVGSKGVKFEPAMHQAFEAMKADKSLTAAVIGSTIHNNDMESDFFRQIATEDAFRAVNSIGSAVLKALDGVDFTQQFVKIENDTLVLHGEFDNLLPKTDSSALAQNLINGSFEMVPGQGHCTNVENPKLMMQILNRFLYS
jgi:pimeloyl-ACP methyl ester carboxylesterase